MTNPEAGMTFSVSPVRDSTGKMNVVMTIQDINVCAYTVVFPPEFAENLANEFPKMLRDAVEVCRATNPTGLIVPSFTLDKPVA